MSVSTNFGGTHSGAFLGFRIPDSCHEAVKSALTDVRRRAGGGDLRVMAERTWACHVVDLMETDTPPIRTAIGELETWISERFAFELTVGDLVGEPSATMPRSVRMEFGGDGESLSALAGQAMAVCRPYLGTMGEQKFSAGFEVARLKALNDRSRTDLGRALKMAKNDNHPSFRVEGLEVLLPETDSSGPYLKVVKELRFRG